MNASLNTVAVAALGASVLAMCDNELDADERSEYWNIFQYRVARMHADVVRSTHE